MSPIAPALQEYFTQRLISQRQASPHTVAAYRDCFRLLFAYVAQTSGKQPAELGFEDLDAGTISGFLTHLEKQRGVSIATRNARLAALRTAGIALGRGAHVQILGKGRKERAVPLSSHTVAVLRPWLSERAGDSRDPVFPGPGGRPLSRDTVRKLVIRHARSAAAGCPSLAAKKIGVHTLRHTCAMTLLRSGVDLATIALWLG